MSQALGLFVPRMVIVNGVRELVPESWTMLMSVYSRTEIQISAKDRSWYISIWGVADMQSWKDEYLTWDDLDELFRDSLKYFELVRFSYNDFVTLRRFLCDMLGGTKSDNWWIDNDNGRIIQGWEFRDRLRTEPKWDWRTLEGRM